MKPLAVALTTIFLTVPTFANEAPPMSERNGYGGVPSSLESWESRHLQSIEEEERAKRAQTERAIKKGQRAYNTGTIQSDVDNSRAEGLRNYLGSEPGSGYSEDGRSE